MFINLRRSFLLLLFVALVFLSEKIYYHRQQNPICISSQSPTLPNLSSINPQENSIFFFQTSCKSTENGKILISPRDACTVEAAAILNQYFDVYVLYLASGVLKDEHSVSDQMLQGLLSYPNVKILHLDLLDSYIETEIEDSGFGNLLKFSTLWKFGGISVSSDMLLVKSIQNLPKNLAVAITEHQLGDDIIAFDRVGTGHSLAKRCFNDLRDNPGVLTELAKYLCNADTTTKMVQTACVGNLKIFDTKLFYPVPKTDLEWFYKKYSEKEIDDTIKNSYGVKLWSDFSYGREVNLEDQTALGWLAKKFCPKISKITPSI